MVVTRSKGMDNHNSMDASNNNMDSHNSMEGIKRKGTDSLNNTEVSNNIVNHKEVSNNMVNQYSMGNHNSTHTTNHITKDAHRITPLMNTSLLSSVDV